VRIETESGPVRRPLFPFKHEFVVNFLVRRMQAAGYVRTLHQASLQAGVSESRLYLPV
jgi:hypothetical protein